MTRVSDNYQSVIRGVSEQVSHDRIPGQHWAQDNMISDPVRGLSRRHGSVRKDSMALANPITERELEDAAARQEQTVFVNGQEYSVLYPEKHWPDSTLPTLIVFNKETDKFVPVEYVDAEVEPIIKAGLNSIATAGQYVLMASATRPASHHTVDNLAPSAHQHVVWVRGGANSRTFRVTVTIGGVDKVYEYTTLPPYYEGALDTSDISIGENYAKLVNDRVNAYNTAVNRHISAVAKDIAPENIATKLAEKIAVDHPAPAVRAQGPYIIFDLPGAVITADDSGNGELMRAVSTEVTAAEQVSPQHFPGKVIKVVPKDAGSLPFYLKANSVSGSTAFGEVVWRETAGQGVVVDWAFCVGVFQDGTFKVAKDPASLKTATGLDVPQWEEASSGDSESNPIPEFLSKVITHMRMFQDRLMIICASTVFLSKSGDYFNFFRKSVLTVQDDDPIEVFAQGTEDDVITTGVQQDRNVVLCGVRYQYIVPGRENMTPRNPYVGVQSSYEGANIAPHASAGSLLFFCQRREKRLTLQRMQPGIIADRLDASDVSSQLDGYLTGTPKQIVAMTAPGAVFIRTAEQRHGFYAYSWLDGESGGTVERLFDSWSLWSFDPALGTLAGISADDSGILAVTVRTTANGDRLVLDRFTRETAPSDLPYLDSMMPYVGHDHRTGAGAFNAESDKFLLGQPLERLDTLVNQFPDDLGQLLVGTIYPSSVTLTSPYVRDYQDKVILDARLTVTKLAVSLSNSAAMLADVSTDRGVTWKPSKSWVYRPAGNWVLNTQGIAETATISVPIMKENSAYRCRISSRSWLPLTLSSIEWSGQIFTSRRR